MVAALVCCRDGALHHRPTSVAQFHPVPWLQSKNAYSVSGLFPINDEFWWERCSLQGWAANTRRQVEPWRAGRCNTLRTEDSRAPQQGTKGPSAAPGNTAEGLPPGRRRCVKAAHARTPRGLLAHCPHLELSYVCEHFVCLKALCWRCPDGRGSLVPQIAGWARRSSGDRAPRCPHPRLRAVALARRHES